MGSELRRMIRDGAPPSWSPLMRLVAGEIADDARDPSQGAPAEGWPWSALPIEGRWDERRNPRQWRDGLAERCGMSARAVSRVLTQLAQAGYDMRQPVMRDGKPVRNRRGELVYAYEGHAMRFHVPPLRPRPEPADVSSPVDNADERLPDPAVTNPSVVAGSGVLSAQWSPFSAPTHAERSPLLVPVVAESGDPIPPGSPHIDQSPGEDQSPHQLQSPHARAPARANGRSAGPASDPAGSDQDSSLYRGRHAAVATAARSAS